MSTKTAAFQSINALLQQIAEQTKTAEANTEVGGTTHPVKDVDDRTRDATEGARSSENKSDVKEDQGSPGVDSTEAGTPGGQDSVQLNIGTNQAATGEDPANETQSAKGGKEDPGSSHPARTDNDSLDGHKYAKHTLQLIEKSAALGNELLARLTADAGKDGEKTAGATKKSAAASSEASGAKEGEKEAEASNSAKEGKEKEAAEADADAKPAGQVDGMDKQAEAAAVLEAFADTIADAQRMAEKTAAFLDQLAKQAEEACDEEEGKEKSAPGEGDGSDPSNGGDTEEPAGDSGAADSLPAEMASAAPMKADNELNAALAGGENMGAESAAAGMGLGAADPAAAGLGGEEPVLDAPGAAGAPGGELGLGGAGGLDGAGGEEQLAMLEAILAELGITPEELEAAAVAKQAACLKERTKQAAAKKKQKPEDAWKPKTAEQLKRYRAAADYVRELVG